MGLAGCESLHINPIRPEKTDTQQKVDGAKVAYIAEMSRLPEKYQFRVSQYLFLSDFEVRRDLPLFKELADLRDSVHKTLQLPTSTHIIQVYLFEDRDRFEHFMEAKYPDLPKRRAFFMIPPHTFGDEQLHVYTYWGSGDRIQQDLRHELTHALLHSVLKDVPIWLDEGLAEYFELPKANNGINVAHLKQLCHGPNGPIVPDLNRLEKLSRVEDMTPQEYRESWAWVHLMLHGTQDTRKVLLSYLKEMKTTASPGLLRPRLTAVLPAPETILERHLQSMEATVQAAGISY
jgi:hypothetical protein